MALASMVTFQQHRSVLTQRMISIRSQITVEATAAATDRMEEITSRAFDEAVLTSAINSQVLLTSFVSGAGQLGESADMNDVDDYDGAVAEDVRTTNGKTLRFRTRARVSYVSETDGQTPVGYMTRLKKVWVESVPLDVTPADTIRVSEVVACGDRCQW